MSAIQNDQITEDLAATALLPGRVKVSVVIPCLNEAQNIEHVVGVAWATLREHGIPGEVIVADNGSEDGSAELAARAGARVVHQPHRGYGNAYHAGFSAARGEYIIMGDGDRTYDFREIPRFVEQLDDGAQLVVGNRMANIHDGAMPRLHQYLGNPVMSSIIKLLFRPGVGDSWSGMRGFRRDILPALDLRSPGMEFALEMIVRSSKEGLDVREFPIELHRRGGESKLSSFKDGWRGLRFLLIHSPRHLFLVPGAVLCLLGALVTLTVLAQISVLGRDWQLHSMIAGALLVIVGTQVFSLGLCAQAYGTYFMNESDPWFDRMRSRFRLEHGLALGGAALLAGCALGVGIVATWISRGFGSLSDERLAILTATLVIVGIQVFFSSFLLSILGLRRYGAANPDAMS